MKFCGPIDECPSCRLLAEIEVRRLDVAAVETVDELLVEREELGKGHLVEAVSGRSQTRVDSGQAFGKS